MWQDKVLGLLQIAAILSVAAILRETQKPSMRHCIASIMFALVNAVVSVTLDLWISSLVVTVYMLLWISIAMQKYRQNMGAKVMKTADLCEMCQLLPATTTWGFPVCQSCADWLILLDSKLKSMEVIDPNLAKLVQQIDRSWMHIDDD